MLDIKQIRENAADVEAALARRNGGFTLQEILKIDSEFRNVQIEWETLNRRRNEINELFKNGSKLSDDEKKNLKEESKQIKDRIGTIDPLRQEREKQLADLILTIPNLPDPAVPDGKDENDNLEIHKWGEIPNIENPRHHYEIGAELGVFDFERGVKVAESRFTVLVNMGAKIERALMNFMLDSHAKRGYVEVFPPILINRDCMIGTGQLPKFEGDFINALMMSFTSLPRLRFR